MIISPHLSHLSTRMAGEQAELQRGLPLRCGGGESSGSEYYGGVQPWSWTHNRYYHSLQSPVSSHLSSNLLFLSSPSSRQTGQSQPTSPQYQKNSKHNYETSRSVPRSFNNKRHKPPDAGSSKHRDEGRADLGKLKIR